MHQVSAAVPGRQEWHGLAVGSVGIAGNQRVTGTVQPKVQKEDVTGVRASISAHKNSQF
jgi:hypothetical protein